MVYEVDWATINRSLCIIICSVIALFAAQGFKVFVHSIKEKRFAVRYFFTTGGMPSSHSATMVAMVTSLGILEINSGIGIGYDFGIALAFSLVVIYDAMGVRYEAGKHANILNKIMENEPKDVQEKMGFDKSLKVLLGHKPKEVFWGIILGMFVAIVGSLIFLSLGI
jgi:acid phosphatase family membrane protein YuiD